MLTVTNDPDYSGVTTPTSSSVQETNNAADLGYHTESKTSAPIDNKVMEFLKSEAAGSVYDSSSQPSSHARNLQIAGFGLAVILIAAAVAILLKRRTTSLKAQL